MGFQFKTREYSSHLFPITLETYALFLPACKPKGMQMDHFALGDLKAARNNSASSRKSAPAAQAVSGSCKKKRFNLNVLDSLSDASRVLVSQISTPPRPNSRNLPAGGITAENDASDQDGEQDKELEESQNLDEDDDEEEEVVVVVEEEEDDDDEVLKVGASRLVEIFASPQVHITST